MALRLHRWRHRSGFGLDVRLAWTFDWWRFGLGVSVGRVCGWWGGLHASVQCGPLDVFVDVTKAQS